MISERSKRIFPYILPTVIFISVFIGCIVLGPYLFNADGDLGRHLTLGKVILTTGKIPTADIFSQTMPGEPLSPHEWFAEVIFRLFYDWLGLNGVVLITALILGAMFWLITYRVYQASLSTPVTILLVVIGLAGSRIHWLARPHIFTYLFLFLWLELIHSRIRFGWKLVLSTLIMLVWVNTHGAFVIADVILGIQIAGAVLDSLRQKNWPDTIKKVREYLALLTASLLVSLANPSGIGLWKTIIGFLTSRYLVSHTAEYQPPVLYQAGVLPFSILALLGIGLIILTYKSISFEKILIITCFAVFGITSGRNIPIFILVVLPILADEYALLLPKWKLSFDLEYSKGDPQAYSGNRLERFRWLVLSAISLFIVGVISITSFSQLFVRNVYSPKNFPVDAVSWLQENPQLGNVFNDFMWGGYILYRSWPEQKVFIDGQTDFYGEALTRDYETIMDGFPHWDELMTRYNIQWVIVRDNSPLAKNLQADPVHWQVVYQDSTAVVLSKK
jgi:hypothetical protein